MRKLVGYTVFWIFVIAVLLTIWAAVTTNKLFFIVFLSAIVNGYYVFKDTLNLVQGVGFVYWIIRDTHAGFSMSIGFMRETNFPWRIGNGVQIGIGKYAFQIGFCKRNKINSEFIGLLNAVKGKELFYQPKEISKWQ